MANLKEDVDRLEALVTLKKIELKKVEKELHDIKIRWGKNTQYYWALVATPSESNHTTHVVGYYSSYEKVKSLIPPSGESYDDDDNCGWKYTIAQGETKDLEEYQISKINEPPPSHFPYIG